MSHYQDIDTCMKDEKALIRALARVGYNTVELHAEAQNLYGYQGDKREQKAEVIIRRAYVGSSSNDIGYVKGPDGNFKALISDYDSNKHNTEWQNKVSTYYNIEKAKMTYENKRMKYTETVDDKGRVQLKARLHV